MTIKLHLWVTYSDKQIFLERDAPELPQSVTWHKGLIFEQDGEDFCVDGVYVNSDGNVCVVFEKSCSCKSSGDELEYYQDYGWTLINSTNPC